MLLFSSNLYFNLLSSQSLKRFAKPTKQKKVNSPNFKIFFSLQSSQPFNLQQPSLDIPTQKEPETSIIPKNFYTKA